MDKNKFQSYMIVAAFFGSLYLYIQAFQIYSTKETAGVSELAFVLTLISSIAWFIYGTIVNDKVIRVSGISGIIGSLLILFLLIKYRDLEPIEKIELKDKHRNSEDIIEAYRNKHSKKSWYFVMNDTTHNLKFK